MVFCILQKMEVSTDVSQGAHVNIKTTAYKSQKGMEIVKKQQLVKHIHKITVEFYKTKVILKYYSSMVKGSTKLRKNPLMINENNGLDILDICIPIINTLKKSNRISQPIDKGNNTTKHSMNSCFSTSVVCAYIHAYTQKRNIKRNALPKYQCTFECGLSSIYWYTFCL